MPAQVVVELTMILPRAAGVIHKDAKVNFHKRCQRRVRSKTSAALSCPSGNLLPVDGVDFVFDVSTMCTSRFLGSSIQTSYGSHVGCRAPAPACTNIVPSLPEGEKSPPFAPP